MICFDPMQLLPYATAIITLYIIWRVGPGFVSDGPS
jgi:hypothetical protein